MTEKEIVKNLSETFPLIYYFVRLNLENKKERAIQRVGKFRYGDTVPLRTAHFSTLWLIDVLNQRKGECRVPDLTDLVFWKHTVSERSGINERKRIGEQILDRLEAVGLISREDRDPKDRRITLVKITRKGQSYLKKLAEKREKNLVQLLALFQISKKDYEWFDEQVRTLSERAWVTIENEIIKERGK